MKHYKNLGKRVLSLFVAFVLCVSLVPGAAFAAGEEHHHSGSSYVNLDNGHHATVCTECNEYFNESFHNWRRTGTGGIPAQKWTCDCGEIVLNDAMIKPDEGNGIGHSHIRNDNRNLKTKIVAPTCTTEGYSEVWCVFCATKISGPENKVPALNHLYTDKYEQNDEGHRLLCDRCGEPEQENFAPHSYATGTCVCGMEHPSEHQTTLTYTATEPDYVSNTHWLVCTVQGCDYRGAEESHVQLGEPVEEGGYKYWKCACGYVMKSEIVPVEPEECTHNFVLNEEESETDGPVCAAKKYVYYCENCKQRKTEYTSGSGHAPDTNVWVKLNDQKHAHPCLYCEKPLNRYADVVKDHSGWTVVETIAPTCTTDGYTVEKCADCEATKKFNVVPAAHQWSTELQPKGTDKHGYQCEVCAEWKDLENHNFNQLDNTCICGQKNLKPVEPTEPKCEHQGTLLRWTNKGNGTHAVTCSCGNYEKTEGHTYDLDGGTKCKCGATKSTTPVEPEVCKHPNVKEAIPEVPATCETDGMKAHYYCDDCQKYLTGTATHLTEVTEDSLVLKATGHKWIAVPEEEATCTKEGMQSHNKCENCGQLTKGTSYTPVTEGSLKIAKKPHTPGEAVVTKEASCKEEGTKETRCTVCNTVISTESIAKLPHTEVVDAAVPATCTTAGKTEGKHCSVCGEILAAQTEIAKLPHTYGAWTGMEGSVNHTRVCTVCGDEETSAHVWDAGEVTTSATCEGAEVTTYTCTVCGLKHTEATGGALGHNAVAYATVPATCTTTGYTGGTYCSRCNAVITSRITIPALGHSYGAWTVTRAATCAAAGEETRTCARNSGHTETRTVAATGNHAWNAGVITTYPTYYSTGLRTYTCATCAATRTETIPQLTYTYDPGYTDPDPDPDPDYQPPVSSNRQPTTTIPDDNTPLGNTPNTPTVTIEDEDTPLANRPLPFIDVASGDWFRPYVSFVYGKGMMTGMSDTLFGPNVSTTRGMIVTIIYRMENASATGVSPFTDVERDEYYADPISWASDNGVVLGYSETLFGPKDNITREQMAAILYRYCVSKGIDVANYGDLSRFPDGDKVSDYAVEAMRWAVDRGLIAGMDDGRLDPTGTATRAQVATILNRFCEMIGA